MPTTFFGPWTIDVRHVQSHFSQRFVISGSDVSDGAYAVAFGRPLTLEVAGRSWRLAMQHFPFDENATWQDSDARETKTLVRGTGLVVQLEGGARQHQPQNTVFNNLTLVCTYRDEALSRLPAANPFDFTLAERRRWPVRERVLRMNGN